MASILRRAKNYVKIPYRATNGPRHLYDPYTPEPEILKPDPESKNKPKLPDDISGIDR